jgi:hypothetical protein
LNKVGSGFVIFLSLHPKKIAIAKKEELYMNQVATDIWPIVLGAVISAITMYVGFINKMRSQISVLEEKIKKIEQRQDSHSKKYDELYKLITDFKIEMVRQIGSVATEVNNFNRLIQITDNEISFNRKKKD